MILLASGVAQFFVYLFALNAVLFVVAFLWNIRQMKPIDYLGAVRFFMGLGAAAIITFWLVVYVDRDDAKKQLPATDLESTTGRPNPTERAIPTAPRTPQPNRWLTPATRPSQQGPLRGPAPAKAEKRSSPPAEQWWEETE